MPFQAYCINYLRINSQNGKLTRLNVTKKFKLSIKNKEHCNSQDIQASEFVLVAEDNPLFNKISKPYFEDLYTTAKLHRKNVKSMVDTVTIPLLIPLSVLASYSSSASTRETSS